MRLLSVKTYGLKTVTKKRKTPRVIERAMFSRRVTDVVTRVVDLKWRLAGHGAGQNPSKYS